jgi:hypothetical protein
MKKRTNIDFSKHIYTKFSDKYVTIYELKIPDTIRNSIKFINTSGIMSVTGDFGNWIFCREFHPSADDYVSGGYWDEKLVIHSEQTCSEFDSDETIKLIEAFKENYIEDYSEKYHEEISDWIESLEYSVYDEIEYKYEACRNKPDVIDYEYVPYAKIRHKWLDCIYDGFDEICNRLFEKNEEIE